MCTLAEQTESKKRKDASDYLTVFPFFLQFFCSFSLPFASLHLPAMHRSLSVFFLLLLFLSQISIIKEKKMLGLADINISEKKIYESAKERYMSMTIFLF
jgi:hypothetical protein